MGFFRTDKGEGRFPKTNAEEKAATMGGPERNRLEFQPPSGTWFAASGLKKKKNNK